MDHKRGYDDLEEDQAVPSPTKRLKDLSHHRECPCNRGPVAQDHSPWSDGSRAPPAERYGAQNHYRCQDAAQILRRQERYGAQNHRGQVHPLHTKGVTPIKVEVAGCRHARSSTGAATPSDLEKKMEDLAYESLLPIVKKEMEQWAFTNNRAIKQLPPEAPDQQDDETTCAVCRNPRKFKGWDALLIHAQKFIKQMPCQHRGYFRALQEALKDKKVIQEQVLEENLCALPMLGRSGDVTHTIGGENLKHARAWRPNILIVENEEFSEVAKILEEQQTLEGWGNRKQQSQQPRLREILAIYTQGDGEDEQRNVFVFPASKVGYVDEKEISACRQTNSTKNDKVALQSEENKPLESQGDDYRSTSDLAPSSMTKCESLKEALGLQLTLDEPDDNARGLFDLEQIQRTTCIMDRWAARFKTSAQRFEVQRVFRDSPQLVAMDESFQEDLRRLKTYTPTCKAKIKERISEIEDHFREDHLMWLQQVEEVREQFQELADNMQENEAREKFLEIRAEMEIVKEMNKKEKEEQEEAFQTLQAKAILAVRRRKAKQRLERVQLMQLIMEEAKLLKTESAKAKEERRRLQKIHDKVHEKAKAARKDCPVCSESFRG